MTAWRYAESREVATEALTLSHQVGPDQATVRARTALGCDLAYLGDSDQGLRELHLAIELAEAIGDHLARIHRGLVIGRAWGCRGVGVWAWVTLTSLSGCSTLRFWSRRSSAGWSGRVARLVGR